MKSNKKVTYTITLLLLALPLMFFVSCGGNSTDSNVYAPNGSKININPSSSGAISMPTGILRLPVTVYVAGADSRPLNGISVNISGGFAYPFNPALYQMYDTKSGAALSSPFIATTGDYGTYEFFLMIPAQVVVSSVTVTNAFTDTVHVTSGFATPASMPITFN